jgi:FKBP-type peptidyl-prolyl cis-trans isomerase
MKRLAAALGVLALAGGSLACNEAPSASRGTIPPIDVAAPPPDALRTSTGLAYRVLASGTGGRHPHAGSRVVVNYTGWTTDGTIIDGVPVGSPPVTIQLEDAMPGWREGVHMMTAGDKWRFWIPPALAYGGEPGKPRGMLVYDISLVQFVD